MLLTLSLGAAYLFLDRTVDRDHFPPREGAPSTARGDVGARNAHRQRVRSRTEMHMTGANHPVTVGAVSGPKVGSYPAKQGSYPAKQGSYPAKQGSYPVLNFEAKKEPLFTCVHFMKGDRATELRDSVIQKLTLKSQTKRACEGVCRDYVVCHAYRWSESTPSCTAYASAEPGGDASGSQFCMKDIPAEKPFTFECHKKVFGNPLAFLTTRNASNVTSLGVITSESLCAEVCQYRVHCLAYDFHAIGDERCHLFASDIPGGTETARTWCVKVASPASAFGRVVPYFSSKVHAYNTPTRNDATGEFGFIFAPVSDLKVSMLGRPIHSSQMVNVTLWAIPAKPIASVLVGPGGVKDVRGGYVYASISPVILETGQEYALSQQCTAGMRDKWPDATTNETIVTSVTKVSSLARFVSGAMATAFGFPATRDAHWRRAGMLNFKADIVNATKLRQLRTHVVAAAAVAQTVMDLKFSIARRKSTLIANLVSLQTRLSHLQSMTDDTATRLQQVVNVSEPRLREEFATLDVAEMVNRTNGTTVILNAVRNVVNSDRNQPNETVHLGERVDIVEPVMGAAPDSGNISIALMTMNTTFHRHLKAFTELDTLATKLESAVKGNFSDHLLRRMNSEIHTLLVQMIGAWGEEVKLDAE